MKLNALERVELIGLLQGKTRASYAVFRQIDDLMRSLSFSEEEVTALGIEIKDGSTKIPFKSIPASADIAVSETMARLIRETLSELDGKGQLPRNAISLYEKFCRPDSGGTGRNLSEPDKPGAPEGK